GPVNDFRIMLLSQHISDNGGLGYQEIIERQIKEKYFNPENGTNGIEKDKDPLDRTLKSLPVVNGDIGTSTPPNALVAPGETPVQESSQRMVQPVESEVSSDFGWRKDPIDGKTRFHNGIDFQVPPNTPVKSFMAGEVISSGWEKGYGYMVEIQHPNGFITRYGHNSKLLVKKGDNVEAGELIARSGSTGRSTGPHLHFEIRKGKFAVNP
ncbi:MAG: M23 family metallopeptidase, partial [bacterium]|nr:M23 family metallopeptidase [bacterium]